jgi:hypothetical protein
MFYGRGS